MKFQFVKNRGTDLERDPALPCLWRLLSAVSNYTYVGSELAIFEEATNWKRYFAEHLRSYLTGEILEVGAGIGANTAILTNAAVTRWVCLEPDFALVETLRRKAGNQRGTEVFHGCLAGLPAEELFDAILYIDVVEHIEDAASELTRAAGHLRLGGALVVLAPAHMALYSEFDAAIGHFRRYSKASLSALRPPGTAVEKLIYLDSLGWLTSAGNRLILHRSMPTQRQILFWDRWLVPGSRWVDRLTGNRVGKSVMGVWRKTSDLE